MSEAFVEAQVTTSPETLADEALAKLKEELEARGVVGWEANDGDLEIILIGVLSLMASNAATIAAVVPPAIFRKFGTELLKVAYREGAAATVTTTWTLLEEGGKYAKHTIPAGTALRIGELAFYVANEVTIAEGTSTVKVELVAAERGTEFNGLTGTLQLESPLNWVSEVTIVGESAGGVNQESDEEYMNRLASLLALQAPRPITASNYSEFVLDIPSSILPAGVEVGRATAIDGYNPESNAFQGTPKKAGGGKGELTEVTSFTGITPEKTSGTQTHPGTIIQGVDIPAGTTVVSVNEGAKTLKLSAEPTAEPGKESLTAVGSYENQRTVTVFVTNTEGKTLSSEARTAIKSYLEQYRELNFVIFVESASYDPIYVTTQVHILSGYTASSVEANVKAAIVSYLSALKWGNPEAATTGGNSWLNATQGYGVVRYNQLIGLIERVPGVAYVFSGSTGLKTGTAATPSGTVDITLLGPAPLPETLNSYVVVSSA